MNVAIPNSDADHTKNNAWIAFFEENNANTIGGNLFVFFRDHTHDDILSLLSKEFLKEGETFEFKKNSIFENIEKYVLNYQFITFCEQQFNETNTLIVLRLCTFLQQNPKILVSICTKLGINESMDFSQVTLEILDKKTLETAEEWDEKEWEKNNSRSSFATTRASMSATSRQSYYPTHEYARMSFYDNALESDRESEWGGEPETGLIDNIPRRKIVQDRVNTLAEKTRAEIEQLDAQAIKLNASKAKDQKKYQEYQTKREAIVAKATLESKELLHETLELISESVLDFVEDKPREKKDRDDEKNEGILRQDNILNHQKTTKKRAYTGKIRIYNANAEFLKSTWVLYKFSNAEKQCDFIFTQAEQIHPEHLLQFIRNNKTYFNALPLKNRNTILILLFNYFKSAFISIHSTHDLLVLDSPIETPNIHQNFTSGYIAVKEKNSIKLYHKMNRTIVHLETTSENEIQKSTNALLTQIIDNSPKNSKDFRVIQLSDENLIKIKRLHNYSSNTMEKNFDSAAKGSLFETIEINEEQNTIKTFFGTIIFGEQGKKEDAVISDTVINNILAFSQSISLHDFYLLLNEINQTKNALHDHYATLPFEYTLRPMSETSSDSKPEPGIIYLAFNTNSIWYRTSQTEIAKSFSLDWLLKLYSNEPTKESELFQLYEAFTHKDLNKLNIFFSDILNKILSISPEDFSPIETKKQLLESIAPKLLPTGHFSLDLQEYRDAYSIFEKFYSNPTCTPEEKHIIRKELSKCFHAILVKWEEVTPEKWASHEIIDLEAEENTALNAETAFIEIFNKAMINNEEEAAADTEIQEELKQAVYQHLSIQRELKMDFEHYVEQFKQALVVFDTCYSNSAFTEDDKKVLEKEYVQYFINVLVEWSRTDLSLDVPLEIVNAVSTSAINNQSEIQQTIKDGLYAYILESSHLLSTTSFADYFKRYNTINRIFDYIDKDKNYDNVQDKQIARSTYQQYTSTLTEKFNETFKQWAEDQVSNQDLTDFLALISYKAEKNELVKREFQLIILKTFSTFRRDKKIELLKNICCDDQLYRALTSTAVFSIIDVNMSEQNTLEIKELGSCDLSQALALLSNYKGNSTKSLMEDNDILNIAVDLDEFIPTFHDYLKEYKESYMSESDTRLESKEDARSDSVGSQELSEIGNLLTMLEIADVLGIDSKTVLLAIESYYESLAKVSQKEFLIQVNEDSILSLAFACLSSSTILDSKSKEVFPFIEKLYTVDKPDRTFLKALQIISKNHHLERGTLSFELLNYRSTSKYPSVRALTYFGWRTPKAVKDANQSSNEELIASSGELNLLCTPHNESPSSSRDDLSVLTHDQFRTPDRADSTPTVYTPSTTSQRIDAFTPPITPNWDETRNSINTPPRDTNNTPLTTPQRTGTPARTLPVPKILSVQFNLLNQQLEAKQKDDLQGKPSNLQKITSMWSLESFGNSPPGSPTAAGYLPVGLMGKLSRRKNDVIPTTRQDDGVLNETKGMVFTQK